MNLNLNSNCACLLLTVLILSGGLGCKRSTKSKIINVEKQGIKIVASKTEFDPEYFFSLSSYSSIQANNSGLYLTPNRVLNDTVLYKVEKNCTFEECFNKLRGVVKQGRGPKELLNITSSAKSITGDSLIFFSSNSRDYVLFNNVGEMKKSISLPPNVLNTGFSFSFNQNFLIVPSHYPSKNSESLLTIIDLQNGQQINAFEPKVPFGYQPAIRNVVVTIGALPNGFAVSFVGDKKFYIVDFNGQIINEIILGESETIPKPYRISNPNEAPPSTPYVLKIEYFKNHVLVLIGRKILVMEHPSFDLKEILTIVSNPEKDSSPVIDFSTTQNEIYVRIGRDGIYSFKTSPEWFK